MPDEDDLSAPSLSVPPSAALSSAVPSSAVPSSAGLAADMFGDALPQAEKYAALLTGAGVERGVVGPAEADRIWDRHLLNCGVLARLIPVKCTLVDLGSGAGLPGIVIAILLPGVRVTLLEPLARRVDFLNECVTALGLANAQVVRGRAEDMAGRVLADVVASRAVAPLDKLVGLSVGLARPGGRVLAMKGSSAEAELAKARPVLARLGVSDARVVHVGSAGGGATATVVTFSAPEHRSSRTGGRSGGRPDGGPAGRPGSRSGSAAGPRMARPNSRRGGG